MDATASFQLGLYTGLILGAVMAFALGQIATFLVDTLLVRLRRYMKHRMPRT